ncbi:kinase-like domain-containing protein [Lactifluus volemus]|nr:kinase-like domain-containing protein [Lactifluus volemus]
MPLRTPCIIGPCRESPDRQETLFMTKRWWRDRHDEIAEHGYKLRPRYRSRWQPSSRGLKSGERSYIVKDGQPMMSMAAMDATRLRDNHPVTLKKVFPTEGQHELMINQLFSSTEFAEASNNHCAPLLDVIELQHPEPQTLMVFPFLCPFNNPRMQTFEEFVAFFAQICEGLRFMHERNVAHRDCTVNNIMFDPSTRISPRYYFIGFDFSRRYTSRMATDRPPRGADKLAPEHISGRPCNPFHTDIYYIGNLVHEEFTNKYHGFEFMEDLISSMTREDPAMRPQIEEVLQNFARNRASLSKAKLRSVITPRKDSVVFGQG